eukprot:CAMPEP_0202881656 /NCGR_PEP_ID=MMETSP1391-20130828/36841_1 /ASSEMBLY_ACC=CAM_ASM_000867 /TAXON_ID=1034604 /ORGANISM="Chlamydomonas leiostraca, Strain SAG 11-49" /LENGTH=367 /DNA_ID=CAMNT_0049564373 /DNA_START=55 /DNA_END=1155 /DNA_ORIENTATION=+
MADTQEGPTSSTQWTDLPEEMLAQVLARVHRLKWRNIGGRGCDVPHQVHSSWARALSTPDAAAEWLYHVWECCLKVALRVAAQSKRHDSRAIIEHLLTQYDAQPEDLLVGFASAAQASNLELCRLLAQHMTVPDLAIAAVQLRKAAGDGLLPQPQPAMGLLMPAFEAAGVAPLMRTLMHGWIPAPDNSQASTRSGEMQTGAVPGMEAAAGASPGAGSSPSTAAGQDQHKLLAPGAEDAGDMVLQVLHRVVEHLDTLLDPGVLPSMEHLHPSYLFREELLWINLSKDVSSAIKSHLPSASSREDVVSICAPFILKLCNPSTCEGRWGRTTGEAERGYLLQSLLGWAQARGIMASAWQPQLVQALVSAA